MSGAFPNVRDCREEGPDWPKCREDERQSYHPTEPGRKRVSYISEKGLTVIRTGYMSDLKQISINVATFWRAAGDVQ